MLKYQEESRRWTYIVEGSALQLRDGFINGILFKNKPRLGEYYVKFALTTYEKKNIAVISPDIDNVVFKEISEVALFNYK